MKTFKQFHAAALKTSKDIWGRSSDCGGSCAIASYALHQHLRAQGHASHFVVGSYSKTGEHSKHSDRHAWVEHGGKIIDVTHDQYDRKRPVLQTKVGDPRYKEHARDEVALKKTKRWYPEMQPSKKNLKAFAGG